MHFWHESVLLGALLADLALAKDSKYTDPTNIMRCTM